LRNVETEADKFRPFFLRRVLKLKLNLNSQAQAFSIFLFKDAILLSQPSV
jgi:hypothetical protein